MRACDWLSTRSQEVTSSRKRPKSEKTSFPAAESQTMLSVDDRLFRAVADYTSDWESWHGTDGRLIWVNPAVERVTGYSVAECLNMQDYPLPLVVPDDRERIAQVLKPGSDQSSGENLE